MYIDERYRRKNTDKRYTTIAIRPLTSGLEIRKPGYNFKSGVTIVAGMAVMLASSDSTGATLDLARGGSCLGLALDQNLVPTCTLLTNFQYDAARSTLCSYMCGAGNEAEIWNDGSGNVFDTYSTFTIDAPVYATTAGLISTTVLGNMIGRVTKVPTSPTDSLKIQLVI